MAKTKQFSTNSGVYHVVAYGSNNRCMLVHNNKSIYTDKDYYSILEEKGVKKEIVGFFKRKK